MSPSVWDLLGEGDGDCVLVCYLGVTESMTL